LRDLPIGGEWYSYCALRSKLNQTQVAAFGQRPTVGAGSLVVLLRWSGRKEIEMMGYHCATRVQLCF
jgi:hypothetical protein